MKGGDFVLGCVDKIWYSFQKIILRLGRSDIWSLDWLESIKATINAKSQLWRMFLICYDN